MPPENRKPRAAIYARLSNETADNASVARQLKDGRKLAEERGWPVVSEYQDAGLSGFKDVHRPDFERMRADAQAGRFEKLIVWKTDRFSRRLAVAATTLDELEDLGVEVVSLHDPEMSNRAVRGAVLGMAEQASRDTSLRVRRAKLESAEAGKPNGGGLRPFGVESDHVTVVPAEAALIREAATRVLAGETVGGICRDWSARGVTTTRDNRWTPTSFKKMLVNPRLTGKRMHQGRALPSEHLPVLLDEVTHARVRAVLTEQGRGERVTERSTLGGLVVCGRCGAKMAHKRRKGGAPLYRCAPRAGTEACGGVSIVAAPVDELVGALLVDAVDGEAYAQANAKRDDRYGAVLSELSEVAVLERDLVEVFAAGDLLVESFGAGTRKLAERRAKLEAELERARRGTLADMLNGSDSLEAAWYAGAPGWRNQLARLLLERVVVKPALLRGQNRADTETAGRRVEVVWRPELFG